MNNTARHIPVMLCEVLQALNPKDNEVYVDATFGNGGYSEAVLNKAKCKVIAIDRDPTVQKRADEMKKAYGARFEFRAGDFGSIDNLIQSPVNGFVFDIGVSSMQLDDGFRGFSFAKEAPLDMRMSMSGLSAKDIVNTYSEKELADILYLYGEEKRSRQIAAKIVEYRTKKPIETTTELADIIYQVMPKHFGTIDPATRTFQAIRIAVNDELQQLKDGLKGALQRLSDGGRLVVVDFHSLEDRIVKTFFNENTKPKVHVSRYGKNEETKEYSDLPFLFCSKVISPTEQECSTNPRARSAKLRYAIKRKEQINE